MKVAIITITDGANYGNRLQNYALQNVLNRIGVDTETLQRRTSRDSIKRKIKNKIKFYLGYESVKPFMIRKKRFKKFNNKYIKFSRYILKENKSPLKLNDKYDYFICGSDQIWNTKFSVVYEDLYNHLAAFSDDSKRISYAASFGTDFIPDEYKDIFKKELKKFKAISVRESSAVKLVSELCDKEAKLVLDPTMLLDADDWYSIASKPTYMTDKPYIVTYMMSGRSEKINEYILNLKQQYKCDTVINLEMEFIKTDGNVDINVFSTSPDEFIWLIKNSLCVLTDSFHATVFSIIFNKPFVVFQRQAKEKGNDMGSRIDTLLKRFNLENFKDDIESPKRFPQSYSNDYVRQIIDKEKEESIDFLKRSIKK